MTQPKQPPPGVETTPQGPVVWLQDAVIRLGKDRRTVIRAITAGEIRGGAVPRAERLRWYVYADALPGETLSTTAVTADAVAQDLRAQIVSLTETNRLLIAAQQELLDADRATNDAAEKYRAVARNYLDALTQFMMPGHLGDMADL
jgi:hypothetical protein